MTSFREEDRDATAEEVFPEIRAEKLVFDELQLVKDCFPTILLNFQKDTEKRCREKYRKKFIAEMEERTKAIERAIEEKTNARANAAEEKANARANAIEEEANARISAMTEKIKTNMMRRIYKRFPNESLHQITQLLDTVDDPQTVCEIDDLCLDCASVEELTQAVRSILEKEKTIG